MYVELSYEYSTKVFSMDASRMYEEAWFIILAKLDTSKQFESYLSLGTPRVTQLADEGNDQDLIPSRAISSLGFWLD